MATKRKLSAMLPDVEQPVDPADELMFLNLGGGNEVGRSCHIIQYKGKTVMVRWNGLPNNINLKLIDVRNSLMPACILHSTALPRCHTLTNLTLAQ